MTMLANVSVVRPLFLLLFLLAQIHEVRADADPTPTDWIPRFSEVLIDGSDVLLKAEDTQIRLLNAQFDTISATPIDNLKEKASYRPPKGAACSVPDAVLNRYRNEYNPPQVWLCDLPDRIWFATGGYCGEGDDEPAWNMGSLYSYSPSSGEVVQYPGILPRCSELAGLVRIDNTLLAITLYQNEYDQSPGDVLVVDLQHIKLPPRPVSNPKPAGAVTAVSQYDKQCNCIWLATEQGIERLTVGDWKWEQRYFDFEITSDNRLTLTLSATKPGDEKMWLGRVLYTFPIADVRGFVTAWNQSPAPKSPEQPRVGPLLLPYYAAALEVASKWEQEWKYNELVSIIASHQDAASTDALRSIFEKELKQATTPARRWEVIEKAKGLGIERAREMEAVYFDRQLPDYFIRRTANSSSHLIRRFFEHPEYLPKLRDFYESHLITFDVEKHFLDEVSSYSMWPAYYEFMADVVVSGRRKLEHKMELLNMCEQNETPKDEAKLLAILQARLETDAQAKFMQEPGITTEADRCILASHFWIGAGGKSQFRRRVGLMLAAADQHKEYGQIVLEILNHRFPTSFRTVDEWKRWWGANAATADGFY